MLPTVVPPGCYFCRVRRGPARVRRGATPGPPGERRIHEDRPIRFHPTPRHRALVARGPRPGARRGRRRAGGRIRKSRQSRGERDRGGAGPKSRRSISDSSRTSTGARTEITMVRETIARAEARGFREWSADIREVSPGDRFYAVNRGRTMLLWVVGAEPLRSGMRLINSHIDSIRLELKPHPVARRQDAAVLDTLVHGGLKGYQWVNVPLGLTGRVDKKDGSTVWVEYGFDESDPVLLIPDPRSSRGPRLPNPDPGRRHRARGARSDHRLGPDRRRGRNERAPTGRGAHRGRIRDRARGLGQQRRADRSDYAPAGGRFRPRAVRRLRSRRPADRGRQRVRSRGARDSDPHRNGVSGHRRRGRKRLQHQRRLRVVPPDRGGDDPRGEGVGGHTRRDGEFFPTRT